MASTVIYFKWFFCVFHIVYISTGNKPADSMTDNIVQTDSLVYWLGFVVLRKICHINLKNDNTNLDHIHCILLWMIYSI